MKTCFLANTARGAAAFTILAAGAAHAQEEAAQASPSDNTPEEIVITGSFIRGTPEDAALPVDVFNSETLEQSGVSSPLEFIKDLPSVGSVLGDTNQFSGAAQGSQGQGSINLRNLGANRTLVLLNGSRTITDPGGGFVDTNLMPLFALDRIEILKDGAAATYGSDAIAGVANFVTKKNFSGVEVEGDYEFIDGSDGDWTASALAGVDFLDGRANFMIGAGYQKRSELPSPERDFTRVPYAINPSGFSTLGNPSTFFPANPDFASPANPLGFLGGGAIDARLVDACEATGGVSGATETGTSVCRFTFIPFDNLVEDQERYQIFAQVDADLTDTLRFHLDALYASSFQNTRYSPSFPPIQGPFGPGVFPQFTVPTSNPFVADFIAQTYGTEPPPGVAAADRFFILGRPLGQGGNPAFDNGGQVGTADADAFRVSGGFEIELTETFRADLNGTYVRSERTQLVPDVVGSRLQAALNGLGGADCNPATGTPGVGPCQFFNPFANSFPENPRLDLENPAFVPGNENSAELIDYIIQPNGTEQQEDKYIFELVFSGETGIDLGGGPIAYAFGGQYRDLEFITRPNSILQNANRTPCPTIGATDCRVRTGPFIFLGQSTPQKLNQDVYAGFAEVNVPIKDTLELTGAVRYEDYGDPIGSTTNPKGSARWEPLEWLVLRGSVGTTFRGPLPTNISPNSVTGLIGLEAANNNFKSADTFGNPDLDPETALTYNVGAIIDHEGFTFSVDYWTYEFDDQITLTPAQAIANQFANVAPPTGDPGANFVDCGSPLRPLITLDNNNTCTPGTTRGTNIARVRVDTVNGPDVSTSGLDFALNYDLLLGEAVLSVGGLATWTLDYEIEDFEVNGVIVSPGYDAVGFANFNRQPGTVSEWRGNAYLNYNMDWLNLRYVFKYIDGVTDNRGPTETPEFGLTDFAVEIDEFTQHDFHVIVDLIPFRLADVQLQGSVENILDTDPSAARLELGYNPFIGNPLGRTYRIGARVRF